MSMVVDEFPIGETLTEVSIVEYKVVAQGSPPNPPLQKGGL